MDKRELIAFRAKLVKARKAFKPEWRFFGPMASVFGLCGYPNAYYKLEMYGKTMKIIPAINV